jgi:hypothetical protein
MLQEDLECFEITWDSMKDPEGFLNEQLSCIFLHTQNTEGTVKKNNKFMMYSFEWFLLLANMDTQCHCL